MSNYFAKICEIKKCYGLRELLINLKPLFLILEICYLRKRLKWLAGLWRATGRCKDTNLVYVIHKIILSLDSISEIYVANT